MRYMKYLLYKTGHFPKYEPDVADVLRAAICVHEIKAVVTPKGRHYFYVLPARQDWAYLSEVMRIFRSNGIILLPHKSRHYEGLVLRVPNRNQQFMLDVTRVNKDSDEFQKMLLQRIASSHVH